MKISFNSRRSPVTSTRGIVATSQPLAVAAGLEILRAGGNAADAAVATAAALNVTEPTSTGIGGDVFALFYNNRTRKVRALNASGRAPKDLSIERLQKDGFGAELPPYHPFTITVPGACAGWVDLVAECGTLEMSQVLSPAIELAEEGFPVAPITAAFWQRGAERQLSTALGGMELTIDGRGPNAGEIFRNPGLAKTFRTVAEGGKSAYYQGEIAEAIVEVVNSAGGCFSLEDLANHHSTWEEPISTTFHGIRVWECAPNGQGLATLLALNLLEEFDLGEHAPLSRQRLHLMIEAMRLAFADTSWYVSDPTFYDIPLERLLSKSYAEERRELIDPFSATLDQERGIPSSISGTVYLTVVDNDGNACSMINSNYMGFGTGIVPSGWGFTLQNRGHNFSLDPGHPNALQPGKRPYHTIIPGMATFEVDNSLYASFGVMGGFMQPQGHLQVLVNMIVDDFDPQETLDQPRFCIMDGQADGVVALEEGIDPDVMSGLASMGHPVQPTSGMQRAIFGRGQIIQRDPEQDSFWAGSDMRADGLAMTI